MFQKKLTKIFTEILFSGSKILLTLSFLYQVGISEPEYFLKYVFTMGLLGFIAPFVNYNVTYMSRHKKLYLSLIGIQLKIALIIFIICIILLNQKIIIILLLVCLISTAIRSEQFLVFNNNKDIFNFIGAAIYIISAIIIFLINYNNFYILIFTQLLIDLIGLLIILNLVDNNYIKLKLNLNRKVLTFNLLSGFPTIILSSIASTNFNTAFIYSVVERFRSIALLSSELVSNIKRNIKLNLYQYLTIYSTYAFSLYIYTEIFKLNEKYGILIILLSLLSFIFNTKVFNNIRFNSNIKLLYKFQVVQIYFFIFISIMMWLDILWVYLLISQPLISSLIYQYLNKKSSKN